MGKETWLQCENNDRWNITYGLEGNDDDVYACNTV